MYDLFPLWRLWFNHQRMMADAAMTIWHRSARAMQGHLLPSEAFSMVMEKPQAASEAGLRMLRSVNRGKAGALDPATVALKPYSKRTRANARRLGRKR